MTHSRKWDPEVAKQALGLAHDRLEDFNAQAVIISRTPCSDIQAQAYFANLWASRKAAANDNATTARTVELAMNVLTQQPGANLFPGTWWNTLNAVTYITDHMSGRSADSRLRQAWFGYNRDLKQRALAEALHQIDLAA
jgi:hypothetical protein